jgi:hypothetical protein
LEIEGLGVSIRHIREFYKLNVCCASKKSSSCASAANVVCGDFGLFKTNKLHGL